MPQRISTPQAELHNHLGGSVDPAVLWAIAHRQGIKLPTKDFWEFHKMVTMTADQNLDQINDQYYWTELIQSSPEAIEEAVKGVFGGGYRNCNIVLHELRFNPMKRNRDGERDLDHIIQAAIWGMERAKLEYPQIRAGLIVMMDRTFPVELNNIICQKAIKFGGSGVIGLDLAGPPRPDFSMADHARLFQEARDAGLGITVHTGEWAGSADEMKFVVHNIKPNRIGHGIRCVTSIDIMKEIVDLDITLETCPTSNLKNRNIPRIDELKRIYRILIDNKVKFCINTDGPELYQQNLLKEQKLLLECDALTQDEINKSIQDAFAATFIKG